MRKVYTGLNTTNLSAAFPAEPSLNWKAHTAGKNGTLVAVVMDESGSMTSCWDATISGFNEFLQGQQNTTGAGEAYLTLVKFDAPNIKTVYSNVNVKNAAPLNRETYKPNGGTNLFDAIGETLNNVNRVLESVSQEERPGVIVVIMTDGEENSSRSYSGDQIKSMVKTSEASDWTFQFLGANVDAFAMGATFGMNTSNTLAYNTASMGNTMNVLSRSTSNIRVAKSAGVSTAELYTQSLYSEEDRAKSVEK